MKKVVVFILSLLIFNAVNAESEKALFSKCVDGDTAYFLVNENEIKVRFLAIDTPETNHPKKGEEPYGREAKEYTCDKITNAQNIELEFDDGSDEKDKYKDFTVDIGNFYGHRHYRMPGRQSGI